MNKHMKIFYIIIFFLILISSYEFYQNFFSSERKIVEKYILQNKKVKNIVGDVFNLTWKKSLYHNDYSMLMYLVNGNKNNVNIYVYYKNLDDNITINKMQIQNLITGNFYENE
ncbi:hypothetical protein FJR48_03390 [Sulfurimonas lithotrophica]|uniref:DUF3139 domain-containing protein n=1 Tax=Sulfurimonas lithotrophica TaxID=2590022 RepID=A0A5P8NZH0_9BACT|nr:hypothetical protein [Sulfurimonas lithotrophica]QFR48814.1 hypothetical protein FJR48_03390 [Sulfurimonas lithotrophica]